MKKPNKPNRICGDCIHYCACSAWNVGSLLNTNAENCINYRFDRPMNCGPANLDGLGKALQKIPTVVIDDKVEAINAATSVLTDISNTLNTIAATLRQWMEISR